MRCNGGEIALISTLLFPKEKTKPHQTTELTVSRTQATVLNFIMLIGYMSALDVRNQCLVKSLKKVRLLFVFFRSL